MNGGAKCCGAVCPHIIIQVAVLASVDFRFRKTKAGGTDGIGGYGYFLGDICYNPHLLCYICKNKGFCL